MISGIYAKRWYKLKPTAQNLEKKSFACLHLLSDCAIVAMFIEGSMIQ